MGVGRIFSGGGQKGIFPKVFPGGAKSDEICFLLLEIERTTFFCLEFQNPEGTSPPLPPLPTPMVVTAHQSYHLVAVIG